jgi:hypothetical protein
MAEAELKVEQGHTPPLIWWCMFAGPIAWAADLGFSYVLTQHSCSTGHHYVLHVITLVCFLLALSGAFAGLYENFRTPDDAVEEGRRPRDRAYFQVLFGLIFSFAFAVAVVAASVPRWILSPCD